MRIIIIIISERAPEIAQPLRGSCLLPLMFTDEELEAIARSGLLREWREREHIPAQI